jgi:pyridoxal 5'-phosphate synthase pdxT subunit
MKVGILAVQGDFQAHEKMLERLGVESVLVRTPADLAEVRGLILPGGESTTHWKILSEEQFLGAIQKFAKDGGAFFGTCAGAILLAREVHGPSQPSLGLMDMAVQRNGYGRQLSSEVRMGKTKLKNAPVEMVFIRAPIIEELGPEVTVLAEEYGHPVLVEQGNCLAATFHPELTSDSSIHEYFLKKLRNGG